MFLLYCGLRGGDTKRADPIITKYVWVHYEIVDIKMQAALKHSCQSVYFEGTVQESFNSSLPCSLGGCEW